jgi:hypothetical protein
MPSSKELQDFNCSQGCATHYEELKPFLRALVDLNLTRQVVDDVSTDGRRRILVSARTDSDAETVVEMMDRFGWELEGALKLCPTQNGGALYFVKEGQ